MNKLGKQMTTQTTEKLANPGPLGLCGFALTTWLLSLINAGIFDKQDGISIVLAMAFAFGGTAQLIAGIMEYRKGNTFGFTAFISYGSFWWSWALFVQFMPTASPAFLGCYLAAWGTFTLMMFIASFSKPKALRVVFFFLVLTFYALAIGDGFGYHGLVQIGGCLGLITALSAFYLAAAEMINENFGKEILPI
ncbi:acetate uptake transporter [Avibacterium avium]|uniref:acetate uptake transporter n=1 Tax=Avibacterium avium TaxID=751 RepID=UPI003BF899CC